MKIFIFNIYNEVTKKLVEEIYYDDIINYKYHFYQ